MLSNDILKTREFKATEPIAIKTVTNLDSDIEAENNRLLALTQGNDFYYDSNSSAQETINTNFGVRRGLVYYTTKIAQDKNSTIPRNVKQLYSSQQGNHRRSLRFISKHIEEANQYEGS